MEPLTGDDPAGVGGYRLVARLGGGGMGRVYLAVTAAGRPVALKVISRDFGEDPKFRARFRQETDAARRVHGIYTAQVLDVGPDAHPPWVVTAYVAGPSLEESVARHGLMPADTVLLLMAGVAEALQAIHETGVVHRDLKPSNILLPADGPRVIDFGIARAAEAASVTRAGMGPGSAPFMTPEQVTGQPVSPATDLFSLGSVTAYAALGRKPFGADDTAATLYRIVNEEPDLTGCPALVRDIIARCLAKEPAQRPSPAEVITRCREHSAGRTLQAWLPADVAADLTRHDTPGHPAIVSIATTPVPITPPSQAPSPGRIAPPFHSPEVPVTRSGSVRRALGRRGPLVGAVAAVLVAAAASAGLTAALSGGHHGTGAAAVAGARSARPSTARPGTSHSSTATAATAKPTQSPSAESCVAGTWKTVYEDITEKVASTHRQFTQTANGPLDVLRANGTETVTYGDPTVLSGTYNGQVYHLNVIGVETDHWAVRNGEMLTSDASSHASYWWSLGATTTTRTPEMAVSGTLRFSCSGNTLREYFSGGSATLTKQS